MITEEHPATAMGNLEDAPHARAAGQHGREYKAQRAWLGVRRTSWCGVAERGGARAAEAAQG